jgi:hypothetical protein
MNQALLTLLACLTCVVPALTAEVAAPPAELIQSWKLSPFYTKHLSVEGMPILASAKVSDYALQEGAFLIRHMIGNRPEILHALATNRVRFVIMAHSEMTTDVPEHSDLQPKAYWNRRARGLGATPARPAVSCGEENLLTLPGDPYWQENILIHEFAHAIHERGMSIVDPTFDQRLLAAYEHAKANGLWEGTYAMQNRSEYWAEAAQSWFDCNRANDKEHGPIDTRDKLKPYDPDVAKLLTEVYGDTPWRYLKPTKRPASEKAHLAGFDVKKAGRFVWPESAPSLDALGDILAWLEPKEIPSASPRAPGKKTTVHFINRRGVKVSIDWLDFDGNRKHFTDVRPGLTGMQSTYSGHVWIISDGDKTLGAVVASETEGRAEIR